MCLLWAFGVFQISGNYVFFSIKVFKPARLQKTVEVLPARHINKSPKVRQSSEQLPWLFS
jgi:hypothetical protein